MITPPSYGTHIPPIWQGLYDALYQPYNHHIHNPQSSQSNFLPNPNITCSSHYTPSRHTVEGYDYHYHGHHKPHMMPSRNDVSPPSSLFPTIAQWLERLQDDHSVFPDGQNLIQYTVPLSQKGYFHLDDLLQACSSVGAQGLQEIDVGLSHGLSEKLYALICADCKGIIRNFEASC